MDGVLADVYSQFLKYHELESRERLALKNLTGLTESEAFPNGRKHVHSIGFFRNAPVIADSQQVMMELNQKYHVFVVSAATEFPQSISEKQLWLNEYFPFIGWEQMVFCGSKEIINASVMIDDHLKNLDKFKGDTILFTQPHNLKITPKKHRRVAGWVDIAKILL